MKETICKLAAIAGQPSVDFGSCNFTPLFEGNSYSLVPEVSSFLGECVPSVKIDLGFHRIFSAEDIEKENQNNIPSYLCSPHGFVTIATDLGGNAYSVDVTTGRVYELSHEKYEPDGIEPGWNADCTAFLPTKPVNRENIIETSDGYWESISDFLEDCLEDASGRSAR